MIYILIEQNNTSSSNVNDLLELCIIEKQWNTQSLRFVILLCCRVYCLFRTHQAASTKYKKNEDGTYCSFAKHRGNVSMEQQGYIVVHTKNGTSFVPKSGKCE